jgi:hypothetical protein
LLPGVVLMHSGRPSRRQQVEAALRYAGLDSLVSGVEAGRRYGLRRLPDDTDIHVLVPANRRQSSRGFVTIERTTRMPERTWVDDVRCAPLVRAVLDAVRRMRRIDDVRAVLSEVVQRGLCQPRVLIAELDAGTRWGTALPRTVLREVIVGVRSVAEAWALQVWRQSGLPEFNWNVPIRDAGGRLLAVPDAWLDSVALAWEIESYEWHTAPKDHARSVKRNSRLAAAGVVVVQTLPSSLRDEPDAVVRDLVSAYRHAQRRPRPDVYMSA